MKNLTTSRTANLVTSLLILAFVIVYMLTGYLTLDEESRRVPLLTAYVTIFLLALDLFNHARPKDKLEFDEEMNDVSISREIIAILYVGGLALGIYLLGYFLALPIYLIASIFYLGRQSLRLAILVALPASITVYVVFELLLKFQLFRGVLFT